MNVLHKLFWQIHETLLDEPLVNAICVDQQGECPETENSSCLDIPKTLATLATCFAWRTLTNRHFKFLSIQKDIRHLSRVEAVNPITAYILFTHGSCNPCKCTCVLFPFLNCRENVDFGSGCERGQPSDLNYSFF